MTLHKRNYSLCKLLCTARVCLFQQLCRSGRLNWEKRDVCLSADVFLIELWSNHCSLDIILDLCFSRKAAQGGRKGLLDVLDIQVWVEGNSHVSDFQVSHHAAAMLAIVVEWELEAEGIFISARRITGIARLLLLHIWSGEKCLDFVEQLPALSA
jgi:hypothetical protein